MSERMTGITLPGSSYTGLADWGRKTPEEMIRQIRVHAESMKLQAEEILAATDSDFRIQTYTGVHVQRNRETLQEGRSNA